MQDSPQQQARFSQPYCRFAAYDSKFITVLDEHRGCLVTVDGGAVSVTRAPSTLLYRAPITSTTLVVSKVVGRLGGIHLVDPEHRWLVDFSHCYRAGLARTAGGKLKLFVGLGGIRGLTIGRQLQKQFVDALVAGGAHVAEE